LPSADLAWPFVVGVVVRQMVCRRIMLACSLRLE